MICRTDDLSQAARNVNHLLYRWDANRSGQRLLRLLMLVLSLDPSQFWGFALVTPILDTARPCGNPENTDINHIET